MEVKERPILMRGPMVLAVLRDVDPKTQTRRLVKRRDFSAKFLASCPAIGVQATLEQMPEEMRCPYGVPGDRLWVRETFAKITTRDFGRDRDTILYRATDEEVAAHRYKPGAFKWRPSIFMPRALSRILLELTEVRMQSLKSITEADALAEGIEKLDPRQSAVTTISRFSALWDSINGKPGKNGSYNAWIHNPWVWALTFRRLS